MNRITDEDLQRYNDAIKLTQLPWTAHSVLRHWLVTSSAPTGNVVADSFRFEVLARASAAMPAAYDELQQLRVWARRTVEFLKAPTSNADLLNIAAEAARLGIE